jgi:membrane-associated protein
MEIVNSFFDVFLHLDTHLFRLVTEYRNWTYLILFCIIFCETGLVVTPFLPGDSLLFAAGAIAALGILNIWILIGLLCIAAILGDSVNYSLGKFLGEKVFDRNYRLIKKEYLYRTHEFYEKHGGKTIIIARFVPIIRTFAPFVAGVGSMNYLRFILFNIIGGILWVFICSFGGYFFGNLPFVKNNFSVVVLAIVFISILPMIVEYLKYKLKPKQIEKNKILGQDKRIY